MRRTPELPAAASVTTAAAGAAAVLGILAVYSPRNAVLALLAIAFVAVAIARLPLAVAAFIVLTFPAHLPGSLGAGATLAKPVGALLVLAWGGAVLTRRADIPLLPKRQPVLFCALAGLLVFGGVSTLWAAAPSQTQTGLGRLILNAALLVVAYTAASTRSGFRTIVYGYLLGSVVTSVYTVASGSYNGASGRLAGVVDSDYFAAELIPAILIACFLVTTGPRRARWLAGAIGVADLAAFVLTQSRGAIVGLGLALLVGVALAGRARPRILALVLVLVAGGLGYYFGYKPSHVFQTGPRGGGLSAASSGRLDEWRVALRVAEAHPIGGAGLGNYQTVEASYATQTLNLEFSRFIVTDRLVAHNTYLQIAAELGAVGLGLLLAVFVLPLRIARRALAGLGRQRDDLEFPVRGLLAGTVGMLTAYFFLSAEYEKPLWLVLALLASAPALLRDDATEGSEANLSTVDR